MPKLYRYISLEIISVFFAATFLLLSVILSFRLANLLGKAANGDLPIAAVLHMTGILATRFLVVLSPLSFTLAATVALGRLYRDSEMSAMFALGVSHRSVAVGILIPALPLAVFLLYMTFYVLPGIFRQQDVVYGQAKQELGIHMLTDHSFRQITPQLTVFAENVRQDNIEGFFIYRLKEQNELIYAQHASLIQRDQASFMDLRQGIYLSWDNSLQPGNIEWSRFEKGEFFIPQSEAVRPSARARNFESSALTKAPEHQAELQNRMAPALYVLLSVLAIPLLAHSKPRENRYSKMFFVFIIYAIYTNLVQLLLITIQKGKLPPWPGSLLMHACALVILFIVWWRWEYPRTKRKPT